MNKKTPIITMGVLLGSGVCAHDFMRCCLCGVYKLIFQEKSLYLIFAIYNRKAVTVTQGDEISFAIIRLNHFNNLKRSAIHGQVKCSQKHLTITCGKINPIARNKSRLTRSRLSHYDMSPSKEL